MSKATNDKEAGEGNNKIKILGIVIAVAMIVLILSSGVAGYDDGKNESGEELPDLFVKSDEELERLSVSNLKSRHFYIFQLFNKRKNNFGSVGLIWLWEKQKIYVSLVVRNTDSIDAKNVTIELFVDGDLKETQTIDVLSGWFETAWFNWDPPYGTVGKHRIEVRIDPYNQIEEQNETNNIVYEDVYFSLYGDLFYPFRRLIILFLLVSALIIIFKKYLYNKIKTKIERSKQQ